MTDLGDETLIAYEAGAGQYIETSHQGPRVRAWLDRIARLIPHAVVLEVGSGPGWDADYLESRGLVVLRTDAAGAFVERLRAQGRDAERLDIRRDSLGGPHDGILANAVLLHLTEPQFLDFLLRARRAVRDGGFVACSLKEGDGSSVNASKLGLPRHETYWREGPLKAAFDQAGWTVESCERVVGETAVWLKAICRAAVLEPQKCN
jgi:SAM-dependent methyltransferase